MVGRQSWRALKREELTINFSHPFKGLTSQTCCYIFSHDLPFTLHRAFRLITLDTAVTASLIYVYGTSVKQNSDELKLKIYSIILITHFKNDYHFNSNEIHNEVNYCIF